LELSEFAWVSLAHLLTDATDELAEILGVTLDRVPLAVAEGLRVLLVVAEDPDRAGVDTLAHVHEVAVPVGIDVGLVLHQADEG